MKLLSCKWTDTIPQEEKMSTFYLLTIILYFKCLKCINNIFIFRQILNNVNMYLLCMCVYLNLFIAERLDGLCKKKTEKSIKEWLQIPEENYTVNEEVIKDGKKRVNIILLIIVLLLEV